MAKESKEGITVKKEENLSEWYNQVVQKAELADYSAVKGCMVIRPHGYAIWEKIQEYFNQRLKEHKVKNSYFPLFIPESFFKKEAEHAEGFSPEVAWIENKDKDTKERLAVRPTSETVMYDSYSRWVRSWRDLPLRINQWANIVRWETKATKLFLRTREFLWQEGHCVYATEEECREETKLWIEEYRKLSEELLATPVLVGKKTDVEKFSGADYTLSIEAIMPDGKALQAGTSHNLGQSFAKSFGISFLDENSKKQTPYQNSWGVSTRLIGGLVMLHGDDKGLVLPPRIAPIQGAIVPIFFENSKEGTLEEAKKLHSSLSKKFSIELDDREYQSAGWRFSDWELKGVPIRIELGPKDIEKQRAVLVRRDTGKKEFVKLKDVSKRFEELLEEIQDNLLNNARKEIKSQIVDVKNKKELVKTIKENKVVKMNFCNTPECEENIKEETGATSRCIIKKAIGNCANCDGKAKEQIYFSKSY
jgi:prolyl-tRNA synthetase